MGGPEDEAEVAVDDLEGGQPGDGEVGGYERVVGEGDFHGAGGCEDGVALPEDEGDGDQGGEVRGEFGALAADGEVVEQDGDGEDDGAFLGGYAEGGYEGYGGEAGRAARAFGFEGFQVEEEGCEDGSGGEEVGASDHVGDGFGEDGVDGPEGSDEESGQAGAGETQGEGVREEHVAGVEQEVDGVIAGGVVGVAENRIVEEIREGGEGAVEAALAVGPPVGVLEDEGEIFGGGGAEAGVVEEEAAVVEDEGSGEGVDAGEEGEGDEGEGEERDAGC